MVYLFSASHYPAGREVKPRDQPVTDVRQVSDANGPSPTANDLGVPASSNGLSPTPIPTDYFVPSSALNHPQPWTTQTPAPSSTIVSTPNLPVSSSVTLSTGTLQPTPTAVSIKGGALSTSSSNKKYIIGGAVGGGVLALILLACLLFCCCKRRRKRDLERSDHGHPEGQPGYGQFDCCSHGTCNRNGGQPQMEQKTPLKPFILKSDPVAPNSKGSLQPQHVSFNRRDSGGSQESVGSDASTETMCSYGSGGSQRGKRRSQKRPPPLKLTSLVTPVVNGPQDNPRRRVDGSSLQNPHEIPAIVVDPPQSRTPDRVRRS
ncbi:hypothetical protein BJ322DRAFT_732696 [Thelephora terrestris]|uniref:Uncharacterized protein n=1 Tax=Thelephora terrestris TaxID=56493 RepID=A0A9P6L7K3_9AGAM|nr:hypothetical protein BJ322DRAFT_732696 [Thelephora terrestris]